MKNKGISLIVLIITVVVIIILGTAIIVNIARTNIIENANEAATKYSEGQINEKARILVMEYMLERQKNVSLEEFLTSNKEKGNIDNFENKEDGTYKVVISGYYVVIDEKTLNVTEAKICSDVEIGYQVVEFIDNKVKVTVNIYGNGVGIKKIVKPDGQELTYSNVKSVSFDEEIEPNKKYSYVITSEKDVKTTQTIIYEDNEAPTVEFQIEKTLIYGSGKTINATLTLDDLKSGVSLENCKWVLSKEPNKSVLNESDYTGTFTSNVENITSDVITDFGSWYIHVIVKDKVGNFDEFVSQEIVTKDGTEISTPEDLQNMQATGNYFIVNDIDMTGFEYKTINKTFTGTLDGMGHTISNLNITPLVTYQSSYSTERVAGLFSGAKNATFKNLLIKNATVENTGINRGATVFAAGCSGTMTFEKVGVTGSIKASNGMATFGTGNATYNFTNCYARVNLAGYGADVGGFVALSSSGYTVNVNNCYYSGTTEGEIRTGTFVGGGNIDNNSNSATAGKNVTNSYYDVELFKLKVPDSISGTPLSTENMKKQESYVGWDFENTWYMGDDGYPELKFDT